MDLDLSHRLQVGQIRNVKSGDHKQRVHFTAKQVAETMRKESSLSSLNQDGKDDIEIIDSKSIGFSKKRARQYANCKPIEVFSDKKRPSTR